MPTLSHFERNFVIRLCSSSLSRKLILSAYQIPFIQCDNNFNEESLSLTTPKSFVYQAALGKHKAALQTYGLEIPLLVVDSVVECKNKLQRKAKTQEEARSFLSAQSNASINILTCMILHSQDFYFLNLSQTYYEFFNFNEEDMESYLISKEWKNKAGAVMVEGFHQKYIKKQIGETSNAMGLNFQALYPFLKETL